MKISSNKTRKMLLYAKIIIAGAVMSLLAAMPLISSLLPENTDYEQTTQEVQLVPGNNRIDNVSITVGQTGKVLRADKIKRKVTHPVSGFRDSRSFLIGGMPFLALLGFCIFFFWSDRQPKTRLIIILNRYVWGLFSFVSLWFSYSLFFLENHALPELLRYAATYAATILTFAAVYGLHWYYHAVFKYKCSKIASVISDILDIRYEHYPDVAQEALHKNEARPETCQQIQDYEDQTFETLEEVEGQSVYSSITKWYKAKLILIGIFLSVLAITPLLYQFVPRHVEYSEKTQPIALKPGLNKIGQLTFILSPDGKALKVEKTERHPHKVFGHKSLNILFENAAPFFSCLSFCLFFFWYERQEKNRYVVALKRYVLTIFSLISLYCVCWVFIPEFDPISHNFYYIGTGIAIGIGLAALCYSCWHYSGRFIELYEKLRNLILHLFRSSDQHYQDMAEKALQQGTDCEGIFSYSPDEQPDEEDMKAIEELRKAIARNPKLSEKLRKAKARERARYRKKKRLQSINRVEIHLNLLMKELRRERKSDD